MTTHQAKKIIRALLDREQLPYRTLTARTISFADLARESCIFVAIHGWVLSEKWEIVRAEAIRNGFRVECHE
jgi:hypothetical protein